MKQLRLFKPMPRTWDAINHRPYDDEHQRALEGLPYFWKISWGWADTIVADCGKHKLLVRVEWLEDPEQDPALLSRCHYREMGMCDKM